nr:nuclear transport factor 2 family protein [Mycobacterium sp. 3519A]
MSSALAGSTPIATAQRLYDAMAHADGEALFGLLTDDFVGTVSAGMPHGVGGEHRGAADMIVSVWGRIATEYDIHVDPQEYLCVDDERVVVLGRYRGTARDGGSAVDATFAHVITTRGRRIAALQQITDTARWRVGVAS